MRPMTEKTYNAIKKRNMIGSDSFSYQVQVEGTEFYTSPSELKYITISANQGDFCFLNDGTVMVVYMVGLDVYLGSCKNEDEFISGNYKGTLNGQYFTTISGFNDHRNIKLTRLSNGKLLLFIAEIVENTGSKITKVYISHSGKGDDFVFTSYLENTSIVGKNIIDLHSNVTNAIEFKNSIYVAYSGVWDYGSNVYIGGMKIKKSDDGGINWTLISELTGMYARFGGVFQPFKIKSGLFEILLIQGINYYGSGEAYIAYSLNGTNFIYVTVAHGLNGWGYWFGTDGFNLFLLSNGVLKRRSINEIKSFNDIIDFAKFTIVYSGFLASDAMTEHEYRIRPMFNGNIHMVRQQSTWDRTTTDYILKRKRAEILNVSSITISKSHGGASTASIQVDNKNGVVNPRNQDGPLYGILNLNKRITIEQGYGEDIVPSFTGIIDNIDMNTFPQTATISLRDNFKIALDQTITKGGKNVVAYTNQSIESIVLDLCSLCGLPVGYIEPTGITIEKEFSWQSYADAFQFLSDIASFEYMVDERGDFNFRRDFQPGNMSVAWSFEEGVDIANMSYRLDDNDLYYGVRVYGMSGETIIVYNAPFLDAAQFNILPQKILKIDATEASTVAELKKIAERAISTMRSRTRVISFSAIAVPHLQTGDFIQIFESSTDTHEIYRLTSINLSMNNKRFMMSCTAYYYGDSITPGDLPDTTATQTVDPNLNLIPEMTSNTAPSGVARASSVYKDWAATYSPWRSLNGNNQDYFWDANTKVAWLEYEFPAKTIVDKYILRARELILYNLAMPKDWTFEAYDGTKWITLDTRTNQTAWQVYEERVFKFTNTTAYAKYRINITKNNGYTRTQFERLKMYYGGGA